MRRLSLLFVLPLALMTPGLAAAQMAAAPAPTPPAGAVQSPAASPESSDFADTSFGSLFANLGRDLKHLPSKSNAVTLAIGGGLALAVHPEDRALTSRVITSEALDDVFEAGAATGSGWLQLGGSLGTYVLGRSIGNEDVRVLGGALVRAQMVNSLLTQGLKVAVHRTRPDQGHFSFPSGHTSGTFATATVLQRLYGWKVGLPAYGLAAYVAGSRVQENRHYASDVLFGAAVGIVAGQTVGIGHGAARFDVSPMVVPGGAGISFTKTR